MTRAELEALAGRVEQASGPSYELDCAIWDAIYPGERRARFDKLTAPGQPYHGRLGPADMDGYVQPRRSYTASLDAAMTLVPEGYAFSLHVDADGMVFAGCERDDGDGCFNSDPCGKTPALALTAAALRAHAKEASDG